MLQMEDKIWDYLYEQFLQAEQAMKEFWQQLSESMGISEAEADFLKEADMPTTRTVAQTPEPLITRRDGSLVQMPQLTQAQKDALWAQIVTYWARSHPETLRALAEGMEEEP